MGNAQLREVLRIMTEEAEAQDADANDSNGAVRAVVTAHGFGFEAWFCDRAYTVAQQKVARDAE